MRPLASQRGVQTRASGFFLHAALSALYAATLVSRFGLINTTIFAHLRSDVLLMLVPRMPELPLTGTVLMPRFRHFRGGVSTVLPKGNGWPSSRGEDLL